MTPDTDNDRLGAGLEIVRQLYEEKLPFNRLLGLHVDSIGPEAVAVHIEMKPDLIGNYVHNTLHGGVISSVLDATGGMMASVGVVLRMPEATAEEIGLQLARVGTIDLRVDYLRPGRGSRFRASANTMRAGNKVAVTRMELINDDGVLIAVGTGTYLIG